MAPFPYANVDHNHNVKTHSKSHTLDVLIETPHKSMCQISQHASLFHFSVYGILQDDGPHSFHYD